MPQTSSQSHLITLLFLLLEPPLKIDLEDEVVILSLKKGEGVRETNSWGQTFITNPKCGFVASR